MKLLIRISLYTSNNANHQIHSRTLNESNRNSSGYALGTPEVITTLDTTDVVELGCVLTPYNWFRLKPPPRTHKTKQTSATLPSCESWVLQFVFVWFEFEMGNRLLCSESECEVTPHFRHKIFTSVYWCHPSILFHLIYLVLLFFFSEYTLGSETSCLLSFSSYHFILFNRIFSFRALTNDTVLHQLDNIRCVWYGNGIGAPSEYRVHWVRFIWTGSGN